MWSAVHLLLVCDTAASVVQEHRGNCLVPSSYSKVERGASARAVYIWRRWCRGLYPTHSPRMYMLKQIGTSCGGAWGGGSRWVALGLEVERLHGLGFMPWALGFRVGTATLSPRDPP